MKEYIVKVSREWTESGEVKVMAEDKDNAREVVMEMLSDDDSDIEWGEMDPGKDDIESIEEA